MKYSIPPLPLFAALLVSAGIFALSGCSKPKPEPPSNTEDRPIAIAAKPFTSRELQQQQDAWYERNLVHPFLSPIPESTAWKPAARAYLQKALTAWQTQRGFKAAAESGKALIQMGCDDPMISFLVQYFRCYTGDREGVGAAAKSAFERLDRERQYSPAVVRMAGLAAGDILELTTGSRNPEIDRRVVELTQETLLARNYPGRDDYLFLRHTLAWPWGWKHFIANYEDLAEACAQGHAPEWTQHTFKGYIEVKRAWDRRGPGFANTVKRDAWPVFRERYEIAREEYTAAWRLRPNRPDAATEMIGVAMTGHAATGETMRFWFDRAVAAQFDYIPAYDAFAWGLRPRWGGSVPRMLTLGKWCAQTRRFDTEVPAQLFKILESASEETDWRQVYHSPIVAPWIVPTALGIADAPQRKEEWQRQYSLAAVRAYLAGNGRAALDALNQTGGTLAPAARDLLYVRTGDIDVMKRESAILASPAREAFWTGEQLYDQGKRDEAAAAFAKCAEELRATAPELATHAEARARVLQVEKAVAAGGPVKLPMEPGMWRFQGGNWKATPEGTLEVSGSGNAMAFSAPRVGGHYELRGEIEIESPAAGDEVTVAVLLGEHGTGYYATCAFEQIQGNGTLWAKAMDRWDEKTGQPVAVPRSARNSFVIRVADGRATFELNGIKVAERYRADSSPLDKAHSTVGLAVRKLQPGTIVRVRHLEIDSRFK